MKPGKHVIEASAPLRRWTETVSADPGSATSIAVRLERETCSIAAPAAVSPAVQAGETPGSGRKTLGLVLGGVGLAAVASGVVFGILTLEKKSTIEDLCGGNVGSCRAAPGSVDAERESASTTAAISTASFVVGGLALLGGGILTLTAPRSGPATTGRIRVAPRVGQTGGALGLEGSF